MEIDEKKSLFSQPGCGPIVLKLSGYSRKVSHHQHVLIQFAAVLSCKCRI
jgi:hypothetical protein